VLPPGRQRAVTGEPPFEVVPVATGFLFRLSLMGVSVTMFSARGRVVTCIEAISFGAMLAGPAAIFSSLVGLHRWTLR
jgi:hypothetical protein